jgi:REP element-mobilizing transposase RayT
VIQSWRRTLAWIEDLPAADPRQVELRKRISRYEDAGHGASWLRDERIAALVEEALLHFDGQHYRLIAWCIMPNHVHGVIETQPGWPLSTVAQPWKSYTAHTSNQVLGRSGAFWFREYHDRFIRDERHLAHAVEYVEQNPVKAGLVGSRELWRWSSAWGGRG